MTIRDVVSNTTDLDGQRLFLLIISRKALDEAAMRRGNTLWYTSVFAQFRVLVTK
jgi:hypothetical protein